jgi:trehalose-phosphatase
MKSLIICCSLIPLYLLCAAAQEPPPPPRSVPIYRVTVTERTAQAVNYEYRAGPTRIDFRGTVLLPHGKGEAVVESERGRTEIDAKFDNLTPSTVYGREYLTYTLWAITPEGAPHNLGEIVPGGGNKAHLHVTTQLKAFGLIVTAEPYSAVRQPSDVVVLENEVRPDTLGAVQPIQAKYELMPRGHYTWEAPAGGLIAEAPNTPKVSMDHYEAILEIYEAQNAIGIAQSANAAVYAPNTLAKAQQLLAAAQGLEASKAPANLVVDNAREAAQTAEDARAIADRRRQEEKLASADERTQQAQQAVAAAQAQTQQAQADAQRAHEEADAAHAEAAAAEARARAAQAEARPAPPVVSHTVYETPRAAAGTELRMQLLEQMNGFMSTRDTPRGLVATLSDSAFDGPVLREVPAAQVARLAAIVANHPGLQVKIEGMTDSAAGEATAWSALRWSRPFCSIRVCRLPRSRPGDWEIRASWCRTRVRKAGARTGASRSSFPARPSASWLIGTGPTIWRPPPKGLIKVARLSEDAMVVPDPLISEVKAHLAAPGSISLFLEFDGTLVPTSADPATPRLDPGTAETLRALAAHDSVATTIVSGRAIEDLYARIRLVGLIYAGNHGLEIFGRNLRFVEPFASAVRGKLERLCEELALELERIPGCFVEYKGLTASLHYRGAAIGDEPDIQSAVYGAVARNGAHFRVHPGNKVFEIVPRSNWHRGAAVNWINNHLGEETAASIYVGDINGEEAFSALPGAVTVRVGAVRGTCARYQLADPEAVHEFLFWLLTQEAGPRR